MKINVSINHVCPLLWGSIEQGIGLILNWKNAEYPWYGKSGAPHDWYSHFPQGHQYLPVGKIYGRKLFFGIVDVEEEHFCFFFTKKIWALNHFPDFSLENKQLLKAENMGLGYLLPPISNFIKFC